MDATGKYYMVGGVVVFSSGTVPVVILLHFRCLIVSDLLV